MKKLGTFKQKAEDADAERARSAQQVKELEEQLRDVMFALEVQSKIAEGGMIAEVAGGSVEMPTTPAPTPAKGKKSKGKK
jgi:hypothetical protein